VAEFDDTWQPPRRLAYRGPNISGLLRGSLRVIVRVVPANDHRASPNEFEWLKPLRRKPRRIRRCKRPKTKGAAYYGVAEDLENVACNIRSSQFPRYLRVWLCALQMYGQTANTGAIAGTISDPSGALVPRAALSIRSEDTPEKRDLATDAGGNFSVQFLPPGEYDMTVRAQGFEPLSLKSVRVRITEVTRLSIELVLRGGKEHIAISDKPPLLQTENATLGSVIDRSTMDELPLVNRNFTEILGLTAGTNTDIVDATQLGAGSQEIRANGARSSDNNFMLNGVDANSYGSNITEVTPFGGAGIAIPAPDTIQEFKVQTSLYDAQYGRGGGANVNVETRSGTAEFHANLYYFGRNEALDANNFFANATGLPRGEFRRSQPGGSFGGPVPGSNRQAFFFLSYQATRDVNAASLDSSIRSLRLPPIPQVRTRASLGTVFGGETGPFGGVAVAPDGSNINPVAINLEGLRSSLIEMLREPESVE
jgi:Carboxypeptidase regulatory-like domain/TonB-dependent Receptor Plug Domain